MSLATKVYEQAQNASQNANASASEEKNDKSDNVVDAEYEEK